MTRTYNGKRGSIQAWVEDAIMEADRLEHKLRAPDALAWSRAQLERRLFDTLINNQDRHEGNSLINKDWNLWLIDHSRSFLAEHGDEAIRELTHVPQPLWEQLRTANLAEIDARLKPYLTAEERKALFERWDEIVLHIRALVPQRGADSVVLD